ncbi:thiol reductant ABC exporter subunit CydC [Salipaludibacillus agaradhaerens]|uniref:Thiol reductant ABC exporter subunit CydC n=1 Tax=Salipaludibacillus agaradhaerens TaxID=76935 RepID=A0A9Q4G017_SALAG|nr:thiol reductant ABC exporter subunit CydC [Salipaludibacillus agaradhaerens]MCR6097637.1 thiol reductant ABC exporter subunit CydC [Salipaludibacillus agaradhaerens]MCR6112879.1 thiol reductant ABC exporter subunit CydC [Salipaludibacillus agaradhaerens]
MKDTAIMFKFMVSEKKDIFLSVLFGFLAGMGGVLLFANSGYLISRAALLPPFYVLTVTIALLKLFSVTRAISRYAERYYSHRATFTILSNLRVHFYEKIEPLAPRIFHKYRSGDLLSRIVGDVESLQNYFLRVFYPPLIMIVVFLATVTLTLFFSVHVAFTLMAGMILTGLIVPLVFASMQTKIENNVREKRGSVSTEATEFLYGFKDLKIHRKLAAQERELNEASTTYIKEQEHQSDRALISQSVNQALTMLVSWAVLIVGVYLVSEGTLEGVFLAMLVMISLTVFENVSPMAAFPYHFEDNRRAASRLNLIIHEEDMERVEEHEVETLNHKETWGISMDNVTFTYPEEEREALKEVSINIPSGSKTAIVGPSGSGKSTLLQLILKIYQAEKGDVYLNGKDITRLEKESIWKGTNTLLQDHHLFYGTVRDNLQLAKDDLSDTEMFNALKNVGLDTFSLEDRVLEKGGNLSGGERQRFAIARALLKGSKLWLLDEPTSSVDAVTERLIYDNLLAQAKEDTVLLVSHRLAGLEKMDQIIVMNEAQVVEAGTYDELIEKQGYFYGMKEIENTLFSA